MSKSSLAALVVILAVAVGIIVYFSVKDKDQATPVLSVAAFNETKNVSAQSVAASAEDVIVYTLTAENQSEETITGYVVEANISNVTNKATLISASGASYNSASNSLVWTPLDIPSKGKITKQFSVRVNALPAGIANDELSITFNNQLKVAINPPVVAGNNSTDNGYIAPPTGSTPWLVALLALGVTLVIGFRKKFMGITSR